MKKLLILFCICLPSTLLAQWQKLHTFPSPVVSIYFLDKVGKPNVGFVSIGKGNDQSLPRGVWRTTDGGISWQESGVDNKIPYAWKFAFKDSLTGWFVSTPYLNDLSRFWKTTDGGLSWLGASSSSFITSNWDIYYNQRAQKIFLGTVGNSSDDGLTWNGSGTGISSLGINFYHDSIGFASSSGNFTGEVSTDSGRTWANTAYYKGFDLCWDPLVTKKKDTVSLYFREYRFLYRSTNFGTSWDTIYRFSPPDGNVPMEINGTADRLYVQTGKGFLVSSDQGYSWKDICGPVNTYGSYFYFHGDTLYSGDAQGGFWMNPNAGKLRPREFLQSPPEKLSFSADGCSRFDTILILENLNPCFPLRFDSIALEGNTKFALGPHPVLPHLFDGKDSITISYSSDYDATDTAKLFLRFHDDEGSFDTVITIIGIQNKSQKKLPLITAKPLPVISSCTSYGSSFSIENRSCWPLDLDSVIFLGDTTIIGVSKTASYPHLLALGMSDSFTIQFNPNFHYGVFHTKVRFFGHIKRDTALDLYDTIVTITGTARAEPPRMAASLFVLDYDTISTCGAGHDSTVEIRNTGCDTLTITQGPAALAPEFSLVTSLSLPLKLPPDSSFRMVFRFTPDGNGRFVSIPHIEAEEQGLTQGIDLYLQGYGKKEGGILIYEPKSFSFKSLSICSHDTASAFVTNIGCDSLELDPAHLFSDPDFSVAANQAMIALHPNDTMRYTFYLNPAQKGLRKGFLILTSNDRLTSRRDTIYFTVTVTDGTRILSSSIGSADFGAIPVCDQKDTLITLRNSGCDTLVIADILGLGSGFGTNAFFPIVIYPGKDTTIDIFTMLDTAGGKTVTSATIRFLSNSDNTLTPITLSRTFIQAVRQEVGFYLDPASKAGGDLQTVSFDIKESPGKTFTGAGITTLSFDLNYNTDLLEFTQAKSLNVSSSDGKRFTISNPKEIAADGNGILATIGFTVYLAKDSVTTIDLTSRTDTTLLPCGLTTMSMGGSAVFSYNYLCGERSIAGLMSGQMPMKIISVRPNPAQDELELGLLGGNGLGIGYEMPVEIFDALGVKVSSETRKIGVGSNSIHLDTKDLSGGMYFVRVGGVSKSFVKVR